MFLRILLLLTSIGFFLIVFLQVDLVPSVLIIAIDDPEEALFSTCNLAEFGDGWTKEVLRLSRVNKNPLKHCDRGFKPMTRLDEKGRLTIRQDLKNVICKARSVEFDTEKIVKHGAWTNLTHLPSSRFTSDIIQTRCFSRNGTKVEDFIHIQVVRKNKPMVEGDFKPSPFPFSNPLEGVPQLDKELPPSVYIFVVDSVSNSQALRSLPKTITFLKKEHDAINLRHVNKVGENSHPNGMALFFGKLTSRVDRSLFGRPSVEPDWGKNEHCYGYLDNKGFVLSDFTKKGYVSLMAEDWARGVFNYPNCYGFDRPPTTHYMRPFQLQYDRHRQASRAFQGPHQCLEPHTFLYQYLDRFIAAYPKQPKIALTWASNVAHDDPNRLFHFDKQLFEFFREHAEEFDRSYVFLMGDHGLRFGAVRQTWIGNREVNNPMFFVSMPRRLRPKLNPILKENGDQLLTSFDIHATFVDILNGMDAKDRPCGLRGNSLFRSLPVGERSCRTLPIPPRFCLCEWNRTEVEEWTERRAIGRAATELLNERLRSENITDHCQVFTHLKTKKVARIDGTRGIHSIAFKTEQCNAEFKTMIRVKNHNGTLITSFVSDFTRTNSYGKTAECMNWRPELRPICCCK